ncbi:PAS domain S-box protein [Natrinema sp. 1APR25-10V2]|uniref:PAS domain S-box protein n=1 Tax=Natrinema sp. 1APR25-10V2 TaxID=2951081 RepID=UPI002875745C|nr:PAS domain S-box protein [Natrinema sp. 1APR25-10V2]MDS0474204.1 PAS domain S-box protein [Natrinema sp. 1APR25-10V2]
MQTRDESLSGSVSMEPIRVLCVDDDPVCSDAAVLERADVPIETVSATSASDGLERLVETEIDCVVSEYELPDTDGLTFLRSVRADHDDVPFILYTDAGSEAVASEAISAGVSEYVRKGTDGNATLADRIVEAVTTTRARLERQRQLRAIETAQEGIGILDNDGRFVYVNRAYADLYGYEPDEIIGEGWERLYPEDDVATVREEVIPTVMTEGEWHGETTGLRADGSTFVEAHSLSTTGNGDLICTVQDISDRKERERDLERYETIVESLGDPVYTVDADGRYTYVNDAYAELTSYEKDEIVGQHLSFLLDESSVESGADIVRSLLSSEADTQQQTHETTVKAKDGGRIQCESNVSLLPLADGQFRGVAGVVRDITERKERQRELEQYETILETIPDEVYTLDADGYLTKVVPPVDAELTTTGYGPEELVGEHVSLIMDDEDIDRAESIIGSLLRDDDRDHESFEMETIGADGERRINENHIALLPTDEDGRFQGTVGVLRDITERKARERELKEQNERLDRFAGIVSHDLRNPLNVAQGRLQLARERRDSEDLEAVAWAHERMAVLIENLLAVAREGDSDLNTEPVGLAAIAESCWDHVQTADASLRLETDAVVRADRARLKQLLENLIRNAVEHSSQNPSPRTQHDAVNYGDAGVTVTIGDLDDERPGFYVADDGPGIPEDERDHVFESGYSSASDGTGLGLAIVEEVAEDHGWAVSVTDGTDGGARFEFTGVERADRRRVDGAGE